ncbi:MAG: hypothetical protein HF981_19125 [Desulfobacteraceae bacterium]|nr:hypothetical protein [Desulfobacteraceae bacterium]MBC2752513.1 hypothetical protein [Desulfobacteraceae bacterium]
MTGTRPTHTGLKALGRFVEKDNLEIRCPRLGSPVPFTYCEKTGNEGQPCFKLMDCWWQHFDVGAYLRHRLTAAEYEAFLNKEPRPKISSLLDLIAQARRNSASDDSD